MATKMTTSKKEQQVMRELLEMYKKMPYLWNRENEDYTNKAARNEGYLTLLNIYRNWDDEATVKELKKKIDNLRSNYFRDHKKVIAAQKANKVYIPSLWYYNLLTFISPNKKSKSDYDCEPTAQDPLDNETSSENEETMDPVKIETPTRKRKIERPLLVARRSLPPETARKPCPNLQRNEPWEIIYGKSIGHQVKDLDGDQLVICQKLISDVIFFAKLNKLTEHSQVMNPEPETTFLEHSFTGSD